MNNKKSSEFVRDIIDGMNFAKEEHHEQASPQILDLLDANKRAEFSQKSSSKNMERRKSIREQRSIHISKIRKREKMLWRRHSMKEEFLDIRKSTYWMSLFERNFKDPYKHEKELMRAFYAHDFHKMSRKWLER